MVKFQPDVDDDDVLVLNETEAVEFCTEKIKSTPAFTTCSNVNGVDIEKFIEICAVDTYVCILGFLCISLLSFKF